MEKHPIGSVVNFCSNERRFLKACLDQASLFSKQIVVPVCDHFFDGVPENRALLDEVYEAFPHIQFIEYPFIPARIPKKVWKWVTPSSFWHSLSRLIGFHFLKEEIETVLFLDADEIADGKRFSEWLDCSDYQLHMALKLANYWYFREPCYRSVKWEDSVVMAQKKALKGELILRKEERDAIYDSLPGPKRRHVIGVNGEPMFHHYSWVRTEEEMMKKVGSWGHKHDRDWPDLVRKEFSKPFQGTDFIHGYQYQTVDSLFEITLQETSFPKKGAKNVRRLSEKDVLQLVRCKKSPFWEWLSQFFFFSN